MVEYNVVKFCRLCKARYLVGKREAYKDYCTTCQEKVNKHRAEEHAREDEEERLKEEKEKKDKEK